VFTIAIDELNQPQGSSRIALIELSQITPTKIQEWKQSFLAAAGDDPLALRKAREDG